MNLVTIIGNAVVDYHFRAMLLDENLVPTVEAYGFRLTKGEMAMLKAIFTKNTTNLESLFKALENQIYDNIQASTETLPSNGQQSDEQVTKGCTKRPCNLSFSPPTPIKDTWLKAGEPKTALRGVATKI